MSFLADIVRRKRDEVAEKRTRVSESQLRADSGSWHAVHSLYGALSPKGGPMRVIAEVKRASPSAGVIGTIADPAALARTFVESGASAVSVLTDGPSFGGSLEDLQRVRAAVGVPLLRKDFIIDDYQLLEARAAGADAVLLIVAALPFTQLEHLHRSAEGLGLECIVEVHDEPELEVAFKAAARIIGVNNRNLQTLKVDLANSERLIPRIDSSRRAVAESGIHNIEQARRLRASGAANLLIGEALVRARDPAALLKEICAV